MFSFFRKKKESSSKGQEEVKSEVPVENDGAVQKQDGNELTVTFENLPRLTEEENARLIEIRNPQLLTQIGGAIPGTMQAVVNSCSAVSAQAMAKDAGNLYRAIIPQGAVLDKSRDMAGAVRGTFHGGNGYQGAADWVHADSSAAQNLAGVNALNAAMGVASMVVGQYYMAQINRQLGDMSDKLGSIANFQENEYKSKVLTLMAEMQKISSFQMEIMGNDELRKRELMHLRGLETNCAQLLSQANLTLDDFSKKTNMDYPAYVREINKADGWCQYQQILLQVMCKIAELTHALNLGAVSREYSYALFTPYAKQAKETNDRIKFWHDNSCHQLEMNIYTRSRKKQGLEAMVIAIPGAFNHGLNYESIPERTAEMIKNQRATIKTDNFKKDDNFKEDVQLIAKDGKLYYLPSA